MATKTKLVRDTVHGYIKVPSSYFSDFVDTPVFQRLRNIEQTSIRVLYPSAHHDRFIHSLGTFCLAQAVFLSLKERGQLDGIHNEESLRHNFQIAALLHDCAHSPFSHTGEGFTKALHKDGNEKKLLKLADDKDFERDFRDPENTKTPAAHEVASALTVLQLFRETISKEYGGNPLLVARMITGCKYQNPESLRQRIENCLIELVNGPTIDVDKLDYILRDTWASGVKNVSVDIDRLISALVFKDSRGSLRIALSKTALSVVQNMVQARDFLYQWIVCHHKVVYEKQLLENAIRDLGEALRKEVGSGTADDALRPLFSAETLYRRRKIGSSVTSYLPSDGDIRFLLKQFCPRSDAARQLLERKHNQRPAWKTFSEFTHHFRRELEPPSAGRTWKQNVPIFRASAEHEVASNSWGSFCRVDPSLSMPTLGNMLIVIDDDTEPCSYDSIFDRSESPICPYCYIYLNDGVDAKLVVDRLKTLAGEVASRSLS